MSSPSVERGSKENSISQKEGRKRKGLQDVQEPPQHSWTSFCEGKEGYCRK